MGNQIICSLDIGTQNTKFLVVRERPEDSELEVLAQITEPSSGMRKGIIVDPSKTSQVVRELVEEARKVSGQRIDSVFLNIGGGHLETISSKGIVAVSRADQEVSSQDVQRVIEAAKTISLPSNKEILDVYPQKFILDGGDEIKQPLGMKGTRLEAEVLLVCALSPYLENLTEAVLEAGVEIDGVFSNPIASSASVLSSRQKELGVALVDIGAGTTDLAVYEEGDLIHANTFPLGSANVTNDIAIGLKCDIDLAEKIKQEYGSCILKKKKGRKKKTKKKIKISSGDSELVFSRKKLIRIIDARISEILEQINKDLKKISRQKLLPAGIVLVGGGAELSYIVDLVKEDLELPCRKGKIQDFSGLTQDPKWACACGLAVQSSKEEAKGVSSLGLGKIKDKLRRIFRIFIP